MKCPHCGSKKDKKVHSWSGDVRIPPLGTLRGHQGIDIEYYQCNECGNYFDEDTPPRKNQIKPKLKLETIL